LGSVKDTVSTSSIQRFSPRFPPSKSAKVQILNSDKLSMVSSELNVAQGRRLVLLDRLFVDSIRSAFHLGRVLSRTAAYFPQPNTTNKGYVLNCCGKMPSLRRAGLPGSFSLPKQLGTSPPPTPDRGAVLPRGRTPSSLAGRNEPTTWRSLPHFLLASLVPADAGDMLKRVLQKCGAHPWSWTIG
jgi:hypothetical protein